MKFCAFENSERLKDAFFHLNPVCCFHSCQFFRVEKWTSGIVILYRFQMFFKDMYSLLFIYKEN